MSPAYTWKERNDNAWIQFSSTSYLYFPLIATLGTVVFGLVASGIVTMLGLDQNEKRVRSDCVSPPFLRFWKKLFPKQMAQLISEEHDFKENSQL